MERLAFQESRGLFKNVYNNESHFSRVRICFSKRALYISTRFTLKAIKISKYYCRTYSTYHIYGWMNSNLSPITCSVVWFRIFGRFFTCQKKCDKLSEPPYDYLFITLRCYESYARISNHWRSSTRNYDVCFKVSTA